MMIQQKQRRRGNAKPQSDESHKKSKSLLDLKLEGLSEKASHMTTAKFERSYFMLSEEDLKIKRAKKAQEACESASISTDVELLDSTNRIIFDSKVAVLAQRAAQKLSTEKGLELSRMKRRIFPGKTVANKELSSKEMAEIRRAVKRDDAMQNKSVSSKRVNRTARKRGYESPAELLAAKKAYFAIAAGCQMGKRKEKKFSRLFTHMAIGHVTTQPQSGMKRMGASLLNSIIDPIVNKVSEKTNINVKVDVDFSSLAKEFQNIMGETVTHYAVRNLTRFVILLFQLFTGTVSSRILAVTQFWLAGDAKQFSFDSFTPLFSIIDRLAQHPRDAIRDAFDKDPSIYEDALEGETDAEGVARVARNTANYWRTRPESGVEDIIDQDSSEGLVGFIVQCVTTIIDNVKATVFSLSSSKVDGFCKAFRNCKTLVELFTTVVKCAKTVLSYIYEFVYGVPLLATSDAACLHELNSFSRALHEMEANGIATEINRSKDTANAFIKWRQKFDLVVFSVSQLTDARHAMVIINQIKFRIDKLYNLAVTRIQVENERNRPFLFIATGAPGCGKTCLAKIVAADIGRLVGWKDPQNLIYAHPTDPQPYHDNYRGQLAALYDDHFQSQTEEGRVTDFLNIIRAANDADFPLNADELSLKTVLFFTCMLVLITANVLHTNLQTHIECKDAFWRRIDLQVEVILKPEYGTQVVDNQGAPGFWVKTKLGMEKIKAMGKSQFTTDIYLFNVLRIEGRPVNNPTALITYEQLWDLYIRPGFEKTIQDSASLTPFLAERLAMPMENTISTNYSQKVIRSAGSHFCRDLMNGKMSVPTPVTIQEWGAEQVASMNKWVLECVEHAKTSTTASQIIFGISAVSLFTMVLCKMLSHSSPDIDTQPHNQSGDSKTRKAAHRVYKQRQIKVISTGGATTTEKQCSPNISNESIARKIDVQGNLCIVEFANPLDENVYHQMGLFVNSNLVIINKHLFETIDGNDEVIIALHTDRGKIIDRMSRCKFAVLGDTDLAVLQLRACPMFPSLRSMLLSDLEIARGLKSQEGIFFKRTETGTYIQMPCAGISFIKDFRTAWASISNRQFSISPPIMGTYRGPATQPGDCCAVIISNNRICGVHSCRDLANGNSFFSVLTQEIWDSLEAYFAPVVQFATRVHPLLAEASKVLPLEDGDSVKAPIDNVSLIGKIVPQSSIRYPMVSRVVPTKIHGWSGATEMGPAPLSWNSLYLGIDKLNHPHFTVNPEVLDIISTVMLDQYGTPDCVPHIFTIDEVVEGIDEYDFTPLAMTTSSGHGFKRGFDGESPGGKLAFFDCEVLADGRKKYRPKPQLEDIRNDFEVMVRAGHMPFNLFSVIMKDEKVSLRKIEKDDCRIVFGISLEFYLVFRAYFGSFICYLMRMRGVKSPQVGINAHGEEWGQLASRMFSNDAKYMTGDFKKFDSTIPREFSLLLCDIINKWYGGTKEETTARTTMFHMLIQATYLCGDTIFQSFHGNPSGQPMTTQWNSLIVEMCYLYSFYSTLSRFEVGWDSVDFYGYVKIVTYGDDSIVAVYDADWFNQNSVRDELRTIGMEYTDALKRDTFPDYVEREDITFLKRRFVDRHGIVAAPLDPKSLREMTYWCRIKNSDVDEETYVNAFNAVMEAGHLGREGFDYFKDSINLALVKANLKPVILNYNSLLTRRYPERFTPATVPVNFRVGIVTQKQCGVALVNYPYHFRDDDEEQLDLGDALGPAYWADAADRMGIVPYEIYDPSYSSEDEGFDDRDDEWNDVASYATIMLDLEGNLPHLVMRWARLHVEALRYTDPFDNDRMEVRWMTHTYAIDKALSIAHFYKARVLLEPLLPEPPNRNTFQTFRSARDVMRLFSG